eukprot:468150_1
MAALPPENDTDEEPDVEDNLTQPQPQQTAVKTYAGVANVSNKVECTGFFDDYLYRQTAWSGLIFLFTSLSIGRMFHKAKAPDCGYPIDHEDYRSISSGFLMCGCGLLAIFIGSLVVMILSVMKRRMCGLFLFIVLLIGSILYIIGSLIVSAEVPYIHCAVGASASILAGHGAVYFGEFFLIGSLALVLGLDLWKDAFLNNFKFRMILTLSLVGFSALITFFGYMLLANHLYGISTSAETTAVADDYATVSAGWFCILVSVVIYLIIVLQVQKSIMFLICSIVLIIATFVCAIGYWLMFQVGAEFDNAYYCAMAFFLLGTGVVLAVDMSFG